MSVLLSAHLQHPFPRISAGLRLPSPSPLRIQSFILPVASSNFHIVQHRALSRLPGDSAPGKRRVGAYSSDASLYGEVRNDGSGNFGAEYFLSVVESLCLVSSAAVSIVLAVKRSVFGGLGDRVLVWVIVVLICGVAVGSLVRIRQWKRFFSQAARPGGRDMNLVERVERLEEDLRSSATIIRGLSRQLEKLGIRFRLTRKALKEPIAETAALAQKNSEVTRALAEQEHILEKELGEIQKVLLAMQEQQQKQLELILAIGKTTKLWDSQQDPVKHRDTDKTKVPSGEDGKPIEVNQTQA